MYLLLKRDVTQKEPHPENRYYNNLKIIDLPTKRIVHTSYIHLVVHS